jgi:signal peptidase I
MKSSGDRRRHLLAALFSALIPGAGQLFLGQRRKGTILLLILVAILVGFWPLRLLHYYAGLLVLFSAWIGLYLYAACAAQLARHLPRKERPSRWWLVAALPFALLTLTLLGRVVTRASGFRSFNVPSTSMEKTIRQGDLLIADIHSRLPQHREVIIFRRDRNFFVKRAIAIAGDSIQGKDGLIFVNGQVQDEPYVEHTDKQAMDWLNNFGPATIPKGKCFVMGDNRDVSLDSRAAEFGLVDDSSIVGRPLYIFGSDRTGKGIW